MVSSIEEEKGDLTFVPVIILDCQRCAGLVEKGKTYFLMKSR